MFVEQIFSRGNKGDVIIVRFQLASFESINFLQNYFINKYQLEFFKDLKIGLHDITDILDKVDRVLENKELASELLPKEIYWNSRYKFFLCVSYNTKKTRGYLY